MIFKYFTYNFLYCVQNIFSFGFIKAFDSKQIPARTCKDCVISREINTLLKMAVFGKSCWNVDTRKMLRSVLKRLFFLVLSKKLIRSKERVRTCKDYVINREITTVLKIAVFGKSCWNVDTQKMLRGVLKKYFLVLSKRWLRRAYKIL